MPSLRDTALRILSFSLLLLGIAWLVVAVILVHDCRSVGTALQAGASSILGLALLRWRDSQHSTGLGRIFLPGVIVASLALMVQPTLQLWQIPTNWMQAWRITPVGGTLFCGFYCAAESVALWAAGRRLRWEVTIAMGTLPIFFNALLVLGAAALMENLGRHLVFKAALDPIWTRAVGRSVWLFAFNEVAVTAVGLMLDHRWTKNLRIHALLAVCSMLAAFTPVVADLGCTAMSPLAALLFSTIAVAAAEGGLWAQTFLVTGMLTDAMRGRRPVWQSLIDHWKSGLAKGAVFGGVFIFLIRAVSLLLQGGLGEWMKGYGLLGVIAVGGVAFALVKSIVESFDGSAPFLRRLRTSLTRPQNCLRGMVVGGFVGWSVSRGVPHWPEVARCGFGFLAGAIAYAGVDLARDGWSIFRGLRSRPQSWRFYALAMVLGGLVGASLCWYFDESQLDVVVGKFAKYAAVHQKAEPYIIYPLFSKWGQMDLGLTPGGVRLLYNESLSGVINWSLAAPLFSINLVFLTSLISRSTAPLRRMLSPAGLGEIGDQLVRVLRWGLWMAPVIYSFLRMAPDPTWYNQDGAVRTAVAAWKSVVLAPDAFRSWSLEVFLGLLAYDWLRILIWFDHMGLRVATLVNLSFVGGDAFDEKSARWLGHGARTRVIPEGIRRFATWAPLLLPFYIPRGAEWNQVWSKQEAMHASAGPLLPAVAQLEICYFIAGVGGTAAVVWIWRHLRAKNSVGEGAREKPPSFHLSNGLWTLDLERNGSSGSKVLHHAGGGWDLDVTRRSRDPARFGGKVFHIGELDGGAGREHWTIGWQPQRWRKGESSVKQTSPTSVVMEERLPGLVVEIQISVVDGDAVELWKFRLVNLEDRPRRLELASYLEWALNTTDAYLRRASFNAMHLGTCFVHGLQCIMAHNRLLKDHDGKPTREVAFHAVSSASKTVRLTGYEDCRPRFVGTGSVRSPITFQLGDWRPVSDEGMLYTFDPMASLAVLVDLAPKESVEVVYANGLAKDSKTAAGLIAKYLQINDFDPVKLQELEPRHRELKDSLRRQVDPVNYEFTSNGAELRASWPTPRPWTHVMANEKGFGVVASNTGALFSFAGNAQQNGLTPFSVDTIPTDTPGQGICIFDPDAGTMHSTFGAFRAEGEGVNETVYGCGFATCRRMMPELGWSLTVFVPPDLPMAAKLLRLRNPSSQTKRLRVTVYDEITLAELPEDSRGKIEIRSEAGQSTLLFHNPENDFQDGWVFAVTSMEEASRETVRGRFLGSRQDFTRPHFAETGISDELAQDDGFRIAAFSSLVEVPAGAEITVGSILGWAKTPDEAQALAREHGGVAAIQEALERTREWWKKELSVLHVQTNLPEFDRMVNIWLPYQVLVSRLWGRTGPEQRSGARGFRDQLQDVLPFAGVKPERARQEILLHAGQQFLEGDVLVWWHESASGATGLGARTKASDVHLWLPYVVAEFVSASGDEGILNEQVPFLEGKRIPENEEGAAFVPRQAAEVASLHEHCKRAIDHTLAHFGAHGLPLMEAGDWNDGLNCVGNLGRGESVWLGFFLHKVLVDYADICQSRGDSRGEHYRSKAAELAAALEKMWRQDRYVRAINDAGVELVFADALMGAWPILSGAVRHERGLAAVDGALQQLERDHRILLLDPPLNAGGSVKAGRIEDYPHGVRENGSQYSHGASWFVDALVGLAELAPDKQTAIQLMDRAVACWIKVSPLDDITPDKLERYGLVPHQQPADVYSGEGFEGRGGWSWYSGSAARMLSAAYALLGFRFEGGRLVNTGVPPSGILKVRSILFNQEEKRP